MSLTSILHTVKLFQVLQYDSYNLILIICWHTDYSIQSRSGASTLGQSKPGSNGNERLLGIP